MFDPYHAWLGLPRHQRPQTYYELLGVAAGEMDRLRIQEAAIRRMSQIRIYQGGPYEQECVRLLNAIAEAETTLLDPARRNAYDARLAQRAAPPKAASGIPAVDRRSALPTAPPPDEASPFAQLLGPGPILFTVTRVPARRPRRWTLRRLRLDPLAAVYLGFLVLAGLLGFWLAG